ncbi:hypothetical protein N7G274_010627 [Stereocaulon virgatum]|uniref:Uncharacterized protein n=1 Tax=Stereocaulon virgatum TaxID=373712 RepID=A0ABR3ZU87_9LECA
MTDDEVRSHIMTLLVPGEGALTIVVRRPLPSGPRPDPLPMSRISSIVSIISSTTASSAIHYYAPTPAFLFDEVCAWHIDGGKTSNVDCLQPSGDGAWSGNNTMDSRVRAVMMRGRLHATSRPPPSVAHFKRCHHHLFDHCNHCYNLPCANSRLLVR